MLKSTSMIPVPAKESATTKVRVLSPMLVGGKECKVGDSVLMTRSDATALAEIQRVEILS